MRITKQTVFGLSGELNIRMKDLKETREHFPFPYTPSCLNHFHREEVEPPCISLHQSAKSSRMAPASAQKSNSPASMLTSKKATVDPSYEMSITSPPLPDLTDFWPPKLTQ